MFSEVKRVLKDDGILWLNLGDSYWGSGNSNGHTTETKNLGRKTFEYGAYPTAQNTCKPHNILKPKDIIGIPWRVAFALQGDGWYLRSDIIWQKDSCMPEPVTDRPTKSHEYIFLLSKSRKYYYDYKAIMEKAAYDGRKDTIMKGSKKYANGFTPTQSHQTVYLKGHERWPNQKDGVKYRNKRSVWNINPKNFKGDHFATFPPEIPRTCILAGSRPSDTILDPFAGAMTTLLVAQQLNRKAIGVELNKNYIKKIGIPRLSQNYFQFDI